ncbi:DOA4 [Malassezia furfur]|nr:DOA4 [Malassezia furfur]
MSDAGERRAAAAAMRSPSHPANLRKQVRLQLDPSFSVKSYIGAAATLLDKAQMADAQGNLESAFVHYLTTASVASFVPKHTEWAEVKRQRGATFLAYQELMNRTPEIVRRSQAIEAELKERAERAERADAADSDTDTDELARKFAALRSGPSSAAASSSGHASPGPASGRASPEKSGTLYRSPERPTRPLVPGATSPRDLPASLVSGGGPRAPVRAGGESRSPPGGAPASYAAYGAVLTPPPPAAAAPAPGRVHRAPPSPAARTSPLPPAEREVRIGMSGLRNFGNTCYMNATLQCLSATVVLSRYMLDGTFSEAINVHNPLGTRGALAEAYAQLLRALWSQQFATLSPRTFREAIARFAPAFGTPDQQDSQEFLTFLLDGLHEDLNLVQQRPPAIELGEAQQAELERLPPQLASVAEWSMYRRRNDSIVVDAFQGQLRNQLRCLSCGHTSTTHNAFLSLSLPVAHGRGVSSTTLLQCLDLFVREEILEKSNAWNCPRCKKPRRATKRLSLSRLPPILVVHLKRFTYKGPATHKIDTPVHFPTTGLDLSNYMPPPLPPGTAVQGIPASESQRPPYVYDLYAATHHFGTLASGHYTASVKNQSTWFYCDDARITPDDPARLQSRSPYVLFFRRRPRSPS